MAVTCVGGGGPLGGTGASLLDKFSGWCDAAAYAEGMSPPGATANWGWSGGRMMGTEDGWRLCAVGTVSICGGGGGGGEAGGGVGGGRLA